MASFQFRIKAARFWLFVCAATFHSALWHFWKTVCELYSIFGWCLAKLTYEIFHFKSFSSLLSIFVDAVLIFAFIRAALKYSLTRRFQEYCVSFPCSFPAARFGRAHLGRMIFMALAGDQYKLNYTSVQSCATVVCFGCARSREFIFYSCILACAVPCRLSWDIWSFDAM